MSLYNSFDRSKHFDELNFPLPTARGMLSPAQRKEEAMRNLGSLSTLQVGNATTEVATITTAGTTVFAFHHKTSAISGIIGLTLTAFALGSIPDNAALADGSSLISFPTETMVRGSYITGTLTCGEDERTTAIEVGLGTTEGSGAVSVLGGTPAFENILGGEASSAFSDQGATSTATILAPVVGAMVNNGAVLRTTTPGLAVFMNWAGAAQDVTGAGALTFTGTVAMEYVYFG